MVGLLFACTAAVEDTAPDLSFSYPLDDVLRLNHGQVRGTHNSYHVDPGGPVDEWKYTHPTLPEQLDLGIRQFELDVYWDDELAVYHFPAVDEQSTCPTLSACMDELNAWSERHPAHFPLLVLVEPKSAYDDLDPAVDYALLEDTITASWPIERILRPADIQADHPDVATALAVDGWPVLGEVRGGVVLSLLDRGEHGAFYKDVDDPLMFAGANPGDAWAGFFLMDDPSSDIAAAVLEGALVRTRSDAGVEPDPERHAVALDSGAHALSTDFADPDGGYVTGLPGGVSVNCNPVTAPPDCSPAALEDPQFF